MRQELIVFLREPRPGAVKTRLAAALGDADAALVYRALAEHTLRATSCPDYARVLYATPDADPAALRDWLPGERFETQRGDDLGARMGNAFADAFARGATRAAIVGTDAPMVTLRHVADALAALEECDVVLGPAHDGGYYLLAMDRPRPALFQGIAWSTPAVLSATAERAGALGLSVRMLETLRDVDTVQDLRAEWDRVAPLLEPARRERIGRRL
jgi:rSAM/selenodomain-associated transferase 1